MQLFHIYSANPSGKTAKTGGGNRQFLLAKRRPACQFSLPIARLAQLAEPYLDTVGVTGSSPVPRPSLPSPLRFELRLGKPAFPVKNMDCCQVTFSSSSLKIPCP